MNGYLPLIALSAKWEQAFAESLIGTGDERSLAMQPSRLSEFMSLVRDRFEQAAREGEAPVLVTSAAIRPFVRSLVERFRAQTTVLSQAEIHPRARLKTVGSIWEAPFQERSTCGILATDKLFITNRK
jgi:flagellar biosynthesis protein FlhA